MRPIAAEMMRAGGFPSGLVFVGGTADGLRRPLIRMAMISIEYNLSPAHNRSIFAATNHHRIALAATLAARAGKKGRRE
jgi:hypothetical protein